MSEQFGRYELLERVAAGGMAEVFKAIAHGEEGFERLVAIKRILPHLSEDEEFLKMFVDEAKIAVRLQHPNIAQIFDLGREEGCYYIALEFIHGRDMRDVTQAEVARESNVPLAVSVAVAMRICEALDHAHEAKTPDGRPLGIIHRDISPQNILVSFGGEVKVIDFGLAKAAGRVSSTRAGVVKGKLAYLSPEQVKGLPLDSRSDIFSLGTCLFEWLTGQRLFDRATDLDTIKAVHRCEVPRLTDVDGTLPPGLDPILRRVLAADRDVRFQTAMELHAALEAFAFEQGCLMGRGGLERYMRRLFPGATEQASTAREPELDAEPLDDEDFEALVEDDDAPESLEPDALLAEDEPEAEEPWGRAPLEPPAPADSVRAVVAAPIEAPIIPAAPADLRPSPLPMPAPLDLRPSPVPRIVMPAASYEPRDGYAPPPEPARGTAPRDEESAVSPYAGEAPLLEDDEAPLYDDGAPRYRVDAAQYDDGALLDDEAPPYDEEAPLYDDGAPRYGEGAPRYGAGAPPYDEEAPLYDEEAPLYDDGAPRYGGEAPGYGAEAPLRAEAAPRPGAAEQLEPEPAWPLVAAAGEDLTQDLLASTSPDTEVPQPRDTVIPPYREAGEEPGDDGDGADTIVPPPSSPSGAAIRPGPPSGLVTAVDESMDDLGPLFEEVAAAAAAVRRDTMPVPGWTSGEYTVVEDEEEDEFAVEERTRTDRPLPDDADVTRDIRVRSGGDPES